jgi:hypothetical protein
MAQLEQQVYEVQLVSKAQQGLDQLEQQGLVLLDRLVLPDQEQLAQQDLSGRLAQQDLMEILDRLAQQDLSGRLAQQDLMEILDRLVLPDQEQLAQQELVLLEQLAQQGRVEVQLEQLEQLEYCHHL